VTTNDAVPFFLLGSLVICTADPSLALVRQVMRFSVPLTLRSPSMMSSTSLSFFAKATHLSISSFMLSLVDLLCCVWKVPSGRWPGIRRPMYCS
jgi:hypothetical protein